MAEEETSVVAEEVARVRGVVASNMERLISESEFSKSEVARRAGVARSMLYYVIGCEKAATTDFLAQVATVLDVEIEEFFKSA
jgi:predicted transcriptional regulator